MEEISDKCLLRIINKERENNDNYSELKDERIVRIQKLYPSCKTALRGFP